MRDVSKLRTFINATNGGRSANAAPSSPKAVVDEGRDAIGVNGASVNDIAALLDYVPPPVVGPPVWAANRAVWNAAMRGLGVETVEGDEKLYEAVAYSYHSMGGELVTAEDMGEEVEMGEAPDGVAQEEVFVLNEDAPAPVFATEAAELSDGLEEEEEEIEADDLPAVSTSSAGEAFDEFADDDDEEDNEDD